ncbi:hypothetical protein BH18ACT15_BH18ACT15_12700 [soil metagenome]
MLVTRPTLDAQGMVWDIDGLEAALSALLSRLEGKDLEPIVAEDASAVTVEVLARWVHAEMSRTLRPTDEAMLRIRVWESSTAFGGYSAPMSSP